MAGPLDVTVTVPGTRAVNQTDEGSGIRVIPEPRALSLPRDPSSERRGTKEAGAADVGNLISGSSAFSKTSLNISKFTVHILLKPGLENFEHYFTSV